MKVFLDTNVVIDFCAERKPFFNSAAKIIDMASDFEMEIIISALSFINVAYIMRKKYDKGTVLEKLKKLAGSCKISKIDSQVIVSAIETTSLDFEDCVQCESAKTEQADIIITRDAKGFEGLGIPFISPDNFVKASQQADEATEEAE